MCIRDSGGRSSGVCDADGLSADIAALSVRAPPPCTPANRPVPHGLSEAEAVEVAADWLASSGDEVFCVCGAPDDFQPMVRASWATYLNSSAHGDAAPRAARARARMRGAHRAPPAFAHRAVH